MLYTPFVPNLSLRKRFLAIESLIYISQTIFDDTMKIFQSEELNDTNKITAQQIEHYYWHKPLELCDPENMHLTTLQIMERDNIPSITGVLHFLIKDYIDLEKDHYIIKRWSMRIDLVKYEGKGYKTEGRNYLLLDE
jgi:hypothetical protein